MAEKANFNFTITTIQQVSNPTYNVDERAKILLDKTYSEVTKQKGNEKELLRYVDEYPDLPEFKNRLYAFYIMKGRIGELMKIYQQTILQHPDYLFGKICTALNYYDQKQFSKMPGLLGENLELDSLYPEKKFFTHICDLKQKKSAS